MSLSPGARFGAYEIVSLLGAGGMGEVYRARDAKLGRDVALKVLPEALAADPDRIARLEREAKALAALNHPHIATLHALEQSSDGHLLVMELVDGETLADRVQRGALKVEDALRIAIQIAEALEAAHEKGIVHRDLKPANVKVTPDDTVKVLDFGLARLGTGQAGAAAVNATHSPTLSMMATEAGIILGTAAYMSPEQAKGLPADHRSDVFSFGVVLYEVLTGRQPFSGETAPDVMASILAREPDLNALPINLNPRLLELVKRCLEKNPRKRWQAVGDLRAELEAIAANPRARPAATVAAQPPWRRAIPIAAAALGAAGLTSAVWWYSRAPAPAHPVVRFTYTLPDGQQFLSTGVQLLALSPDGTQLVYYANRQLNLRVLSELTTKPLAASDIGMTLAGNPAFSPDGKSIAFWTGTSPTAGTLRRIAVSGGAAVTLCQASFPFGVSWNASGIIFGQPDGIKRVSSDGGQPDLLLPVKDGVPFDPQLLPDGDTLLFTLATTIRGLPGATTDSWDKAQIVAHSLKSGARKVLVNGGTGARYLPSGHIVYALSGVLFAVPFDARRIEVTGSAIPVVEGVRRPVFAGAAPGTVYFSVSNTGALAYIPGPVAVAAQNSDLAFVDRQGGITPLKLSSRSYVSPRVSPNGKQLAVQIDNGNDANIWIYDLSESAAIRQLTFGGRNRFPVWSPDGRVVAFQSNRDGDLAIFQQVADGSGSAERLTKPEPNVAHAANAWSPDGKTLAYDEFKDSIYSLWMLSIPDKKAARFGHDQLSTPTHAVFSPDGRWIAYRSFTGTSEAASVFVQPFPPTGAGYLVAAPGIYPLWFPNGTELSYVRSAELQIVSVATKPALTFGNPVRLPIPAIISGSSPRSYDIMPDGKRFISVVPAGQTQSGFGSMTQIQVVLNWFDELTQRVPSK